jgi:hypothetical protein
MYLYNNRISGVIHRSDSWLLWLWSYSSWIYNYLCNQCLSSLMLWVQILLRQGVFETTLSDKVCQWLVTGWWFSLCTPVSRPFNFLTSLVVKRNVLTTVLIFIIKSNNSNNNFIFILHVNYLSSYTVNSCFG